MNEASDEFKHLVQVVLDLKAQVVDLERQKRSLASDVLKLQRERFTAMLDAALKEKGTPGGAVTIASRDGK